MSVETMKNRLKRMTAADSQPLLSSDDLDELLSMFQKSDANGNLPGTDSWIPTYNMNSAAAEGWRWKAAKAAELVSIDLDGERMSSNQIFDHCQSMIRQYSRKQSATISFGK